MTGAFLKMLNMSISASWIVIAVVLLRFFLKKVPKWINCLLWGIVGLRLMLPVTLESAISLIPSAEVIPRDIITSQTPSIQSGILAVNQAVNPLVHAQIAQNGNQLGQILHGAAVIWLAGVGLMQLYSAISYWMLRRKVQASVLLRENIYVCDDVDSPFILGSIRPRIYIPSGMEERQLQFVLFHERMHIRRGDHWWKPLGFLMLTIHWFNPILWLAYILLCRDIECACDEQVVTGMDNNGKKGYAEALIACSVHRRMIMACPVAFGELAVKERIKGIIRYKKPAFWLILVSVVLCVIAAGCFLTDPKPCEHVYHGAITNDPTCDRNGEETFTCELCADVYTEPVNMLEHTYDAGTVAAAPTCVATGIREFTCTGCGIKRTEAIEKTAHTAGEIVTTKEPNCTERGERSTTCTVCQLVYVVEFLEIDSTVHDLRETVLREATCAKEGEGIWNCTRCDYSESCSYEKTEHHHEIYHVIEASCITGERWHMVCTGCDDSYWVDRGGAKPHTWGPKEYYDGYVTQRCQVCGLPQSSRMSQGQSGSPLWSSMPTSTPNNQLPTILWDVAAVPISPTNTNPTYLPGFNGT